ncbi:MAG: FliH/SctL family protein [Tepidimonas sp.]|uniref:FliH/SctL family protein n=1 Tax=Tepidimonas sp. TaxID=2002775 RepID=UPI004054C738
MPSSNRGGHPYQRFIPREEVQDVSSWTFEPVSDEARRAARQAKEEATISPEQLEATRAQAFTQGYEQGFEQGRQAGAQETRDALTEPLRQQAHEHAQRLAALLANTQAQLDAVQHTLADQVLLLACDIARQVVRRELAQPLEPVRAVVNEALSLLTDDAQPAVLRLHPSDAQRLEPFLTEALARQRVTVVADERLTPGGCLLQTAHGLVDATVERRWARAVGNLGLDLAWTADAQSDHD